MKKILLLMACFLVSFSYGAQISSAGSGNWSEGSTWVGGSVPGDNDTVVIVSGHTVTVDTADQCAGLTNNHILTLNANLTVTGNSSNAGIINVDSGNLIFTGTNTTFSNTQQLKVKAGQYMQMSGSSSTFTNNNIVYTYANSTAMGRIILMGSFSEGAFNDGTYARFINGTGDAGTSTGWDLIGVPLTDLTISSFISSNGDVAEYDPDGDATDNDTFYGIGIYDPSDNDWETYTGTSGTNSYGSTQFSVGKGYQMATSAGSVVEFTGTLSVADTNLSLTSYDADNDGGSNGSRWNIVANPFLSYIHGNDNNGGTNVLTVNSGIMHASNTALYFWDGDSYVALNHSSSASTYDYIAPFQGFLVATSYNGGNAQTFSFTKAMQTTAGSDDAILNSPMDPTDGQLHLGISQNGIDRKTEIYFNDGGSDGLDVGYDAAAFSTLDTYLSTRLVDDTQNEGEDFTIQTVAFDEMWDKTIPLVVNAISEEQFVINILHSNIPADLNIYLEDALEGSYTDLKQEDFILTPSENLSDAGRFYIHLTADTLSDGDVNTSLLNAYKEVDTNYITIEGLATQSNNTEVSLFNILGTKVMDTTLDNNTNTQMISTNGLSTGIYVIKLESGQSQLTKKLIIK